MTDFQFRTIGVLLMFIAGCLVALAYVIILIYLRITYYKRDKEKR